MGGIRRMVYATDNGVMVKIANFTDLNAWKVSHEIVLRIYKLSKSFPSSEQFGLTSQMRRVAISGVSNIAEGFGRNTAKDKSHFYSVAKGSLLELQSQLLIARDLGYLTQQDFDNIFSDTQASIRLLSGLSRSAMNRAPSP